MRAPDPLRGDRQCVPGKELTALQRTGQACATPAGSPAACTSPRFATMGWLGAWRCMDLWERVWLLMGLRSLMIMMCIYLQALAPPLGHISVGVDSFAFIKDD